MKKVLIISTPFFGYQESVGRAFQELGYDVHIEIYDEPIHPFKGLLRWQHKIARNKEKLRAKNRKKYDLYIRNIYDQYNPDIVFSYNGTILLDSTLDYFRLKSKVIFWMYDSVLRADRKMCKTHIDHADAVFCFEEKDVQYYKSINKKSYFLPLACDETVYYPIDSKEKDIDILFVGHIYGQKKRISLLKKIIQQYPNLNILIYGHYKPYYKNPIKWVFREKRNIFKNINISPEKVNQLYARTKIALNIHHEQTLFGANQRLYEASGAGAYQICDANPYIESVFTNGEIGLYNKEEELFACIEDALNNDKFVEIKTAQEIILTQHTFLHRVKEMLQIIEELPKESI